MSDIHVRTMIWVYGGTFKEHSGGTITQWSVYNIGVASYPTDISYTGIDITGSVVKHQLTQKIMGVVNVYTNNKDATITSCVSPA